MHANTRRVVVMTGGTGGLGAQALQHLTAQPDTRVIVGARGGRRAVPDGVETIALDLAALADVREFARAVTQRLGDRRIDVLLLNAGIQTSDLEQISADGYEMTFAVNHLAHYLLARLLLPSMADHSRLVFTTSGTHDPAIVPMAPRTLDPKALAHPRKGGFGGGFRAYAASKLCNLLTAQGLAALDEVQARHITVIAFNPGPTSGTSLGGQNSPARRAMTAALSPLLRLIGLFQPNFIMGTADRAGEALAEVAVGEATPPLGRVYVSLVDGVLTFPDPSALASSTTARDQLWHASAAMVGLR